MFEDFRLRMPNVYLILADIYVFLGRRQAVHLDKKQTPNQAQIRVRNKVLQYR